MDAVKYLQEKRRMCDSQKNCFECGLKNLICCDRGVKEKEEAGRLVSIVEEWSKAHPVQTNADKIKEVFAYCPAITKNQYGDEYLHIPKGWLDAPYEIPKGEEL